ESQRHWPSYVRAVKVDDRPGSECRRSGLASGDHQRCFPPVGEGDKVPEDHPGQCRSRHLSRWPYPRFRYQQLLLNYIPSAHRLLRNRVLSRVVIDRLQFCRIFDPFITMFLLALTLICPLPSIVMSLPLMTIVPSFFIVMLASP